MAIKRIPTLLLALLPVLFSACTDSPEDKSDDTEPNTASLTGSIKLPANEEAPENSILKVTLSDVSKMDVRSELLAEHSYPVSGAPPYSFSLPYNPQDLSERGRYSLRVRVESEGALTHTTTTMIPVVSGENEPFDITLSNVSKPDAPLVNTRWIVMEIDGEAAEDGMGDRELHLTLFQEANRARGFSGCNSFTGTYLVADDAVKFSQMVGTRMACPDGENQERRFLDALSRVANFNITGDTLALLDTYNQPVLRFEALYLN